MIYDIFFDVAGMRELKNGGGGWVIFFEVVTSGCLLSETWLVHPENAVLLEVVEEFFVFFCFWHTQKGKHVLARNNLCVMQGNKSPKPPPYTNSKYVSKGFPAV